jgi:AcrR family transcriptional regulator
MSTPVVSKPAVRNSEATKRRILDAATAEFSRHGYGGARVDRIADAARTNKRMLYYYHGSKEALFLASLEAAYDKIRAAERELHLEVLAPIQAIEELVRFTWDYFVRNPEFMMLLNTENQHRAKHLKKSQRVHTMNSPVIETIRGILVRGVSSGTVREGIDPVQLYISIAGLCYFYLSNVYTLSIAFDRELLSAAALEERVDHIVDLIVAGIRA